MAETSSCTVCGGPVQQRNWLGICEKTRECRNARAKLRRTDPAYRDRNRAYCRTWRSANLERDRRRRREFAKTHPAWRLWKSARERSVKFGVPFGITLEDVNAVWRDTCPVFGTQLKVGTGVHGPWSYSLDRIEPAKGYVPGNIQILSRKANVMKQDATREELIQFARWVLDQEGIAHE